MSDGSLARQPWMISTATRAVMRALVSAGGEDGARFVGGCVRNALIGQPVGDIDIATVLTPEQVMAALDAAGLRWVPTGVDHGTVTAISQGRPYEITTLRRDVSTDGRRAVVAFSGDWAEDARRRDFRLNALYMDAAGQVFDPLGEGIADALAGRIVFVGDAQTRIREDYLRILRYFRFLAWYGRGEPDAQALAACAALKDMLVDRPGERTSRELLKLLAADDPRPAMRLMDGAGVLAMVIPCVGLGRFETLVGIERDVLGENDPDLRLAALLPDEPDEVRRTAAALRLSNAQRDRLLAAAAPGPRLAATDEPKAVRQAIHALGAQAVRDQIKLSWADNPGQAPAWRALLAAARGWTAPPFPLTGDDAVAAGLPKGPLIGRALKAVEAWWADRDFQPDRAAALAELARVVAQL